LGAPNEADGAAVRPYHANMIKLEAQPDEIYDIELEHSLLEANTKLARQNRVLLDEHGTTAIDFMGAIGSGKTTLITKLVEKLKDVCGVAVFNGDATTSEDADQIEKLGVPVVQIATINGCHLDANLVGKGLRKLDINNTKFIFIENIGNLICPAEFPLGSKARVVVVSVTEGPWMVRKHPHMFLGAQIVVINKIDLADAMAVSVEALTNDVHTLKPDIKVVATSCKTGEGIDRVAETLLANLNDEQRNQPSPRASRPGRIATGRSVERIEVRVDSV